MKYQMALSQRTAEQVQWAESCGKGTTDFVSSRLKVKEVRQQWTYGTQTYAFPSIKKFKR